MLPSRIPARLLVALVAALCLVLPGESRTETHPTGHELTLSAAATALPDVVMSAPEGQGKLPVVTPQLTGKPAPSLGAATRFAFGAPDRCAALSFSRTRSAALRPVYWVGTVELRI